MFTYILNETILIIALQTHQIYYRYFSFLVYFLRLMPDKINGTLTSKSVKILTTENTHNPLS